MLRFIGLPDNRLKPLTFIWSYLPLSCQLQKLVVLVSIHHNFTASLQVNSVLGREGTRKTETCNGYGDCVPTASLCRKGWRPTPDCKDSNDWKDVLCHRSTMWETLVTINRAWLKNVFYISVFVYPHNSSKHINLILLHSIILFVSVLCFI